MHGSRHNPQYFGNVLMSKVLIQMLTELIEIGCYTVQKYVSERKSLRREAFQPCQGMIE